MFGDTRLEIPQRARIYYTVIMLVFAPMQRGIFKGFSKKP